MTERLTFTAQLWFFVSLSSKYQNLESVSVDNESVTFSVLFILATERQFALLLVDCFAGVCRLFIRGRVSFLTVLGHILSDSIGSTSSTTPTATK